MKKRILLDLNHIEYTALVAKALSSPVRLEILKLLIERSSNISGIARTFSQPLSSVANHIRVLEEAGLVLAVERPGNRGSQKVCGIAFEDVYFNAFQPTLEDEDEHFIFPMGIGHYYDVDIAAPCGLVSEKSYLGIEDSPSVFYTNDRVYAQLLWFNHGRIEYRFPFHLDPELEVTRILISVELCSEAPGYNNQWPSDINVTVDGKDCAMIYSPGDFGGTVGALNPKWWSVSRTQYGQLYHIEINQDGSYVDSVKSSDVALQDICLDKPYLSFGLEVKEDAENCGGLNIFGEKFGNHAQGLVMEIFAKKKEKSGSTESSILE